MYLVEIALQYEFDFVCCAEAWSDDGQITAGHRWHQAQDKGQRGAGHIFRVWAANLDTSHIKNHSKLGRLLFFKEKTDE